MPQSKVQVSSNLLVQGQLQDSASALEDVFDADVLTYCGPITEPADKLIRRAIEYRRGFKGTPKHKRLIVVLTTNGGYIETAERIANTFRRHYRWVGFVVPDIAMSAGTVLVMSGDEIWMDYFSRLGPIDPQVERRDGRRGFIPAVGYLIQYDRLIKKSQNGTLTSGEAAILIQNFDLGELFNYEQAKELSIQLLKDWLVKYKFRNWTTTQRRGAKVTPAMKRERAELIAEQLSDVGLWNSHARGISMDVLKQRLKLKIENLDREPKTNEALTHYHELLADYMNTIDSSGAIHTQDLFFPLRPRA